MTSLVPEKWRESLERVHEKVGSVLTSLVPWKKEEHAPETLTADSIPAFMRQGGPLMEMRETRDELIVRAEVPGMKKEDFTVELDGRMLTIRGEKKIMREGKGDNGYIMSECRYGSFARSMMLPYHVAQKDVSADLKNGVLTIRMSKPEKERGRQQRIPVS